MLTVSTNVPRHLVRCALRAGAVRLGRRMLRPRVTGERGPASSLSWDRFDGAYSLRWDGTRAEFAPKLDSPNLADIAA